MGTRPTREPSSHIAHNAALVAYALLRGASPINGEQCSPAAAETCALEILALRTAAQDTRQTVAAHIAPGRSCVSLTASAIVSQVSRRSSAAVSLAVA